MALTSDGMSAAALMIEGLENGIRKRLRERILEKIEPDIRAAIDDAMATFKATLETYRDPMNMRDTVRVLLEDRRVND